MTATLAGAVRAYAHRFLHDYGDMAATSPLGAWMLMALAAPAAHGSMREALEEALGADTGTASRMLSVALAHPHSALAAACAVWADAANLNGRYEQWRQNLPTAVETGPIPTQHDADAWAAAHTFGMISQFPMTLAPDTALVLASALATDVAWHEPYEVTASDVLGGLFGSRVPRCLYSHAGNAIVDTAAAGQVGVHRNRSAGGIEVISVIGSDTVTHGAMHAAALEIQERITRGTLEALAPDMLELGDGPAWTVTEREGITDSTTAYLPAWRADSDPFDIAGAPGIGPVLGTVASMMHQPAAITAVQKVFAEYTAAGFRAAAVSAVSARLGLPQLRAVREVAIRFNRPYAVVASTVHRDDAAGTVSPVWDGVPVFSAWVTAPVDAEPAG